MLGTYFTIVLALFIVMLVGAILGYSGNLDDQIKKPFMKALNLYRDQPSNQAEDGYKNVWNDVQKEVNLLSNLVYNNLRDKFGCYLLKKFYET